MVGQVRFSYVPSDWTEEKFQSNGGYVAVVLGYNHSKSIEAAALSALNQDFDHYEVFLMDDCSKDDTLEKLINVAKTFADKKDKCVKVTVVTNEENQSVCGQWNIVTRLSTGKWFGMFCGDDVSLANRMSVFDDILKRHPTVSAVCTNFLGVNADGEETLYFERFNDERVWRGTDENLPLTWYFGCTAWWRRDLFDVPMKRCNIDDHQIFWRNIILRQGDSNEVIVWGMDKVTVKYDKTTGVTNNFGINTSEKGIGWVRRSWRRAEAFLVWKRKSLAHWKLIQEFDASHGKNGSFRKKINSSVLFAKMYNGNWFVRNALAIRLFFIGGDRWELKHNVMRYVLGNFSFVAVDFVNAMRKSFARK